MNWVGVSCYEGACPLVRCDHGIIIILGRGRSLLVGDSHWSTYEGNETVSGICLKYSNDVLRHSVMSDSLWHPWTVACQALLSMGLSRQEHWSGLPFPLPGYLSDPAIEHTSTCESWTAGRFFTPEPPFQWHHQWKFGGRGNNMAMTKYY